MSEKSDMRTVEEAVKRRPNLFIVGAPRCGTTSMHGLLAKHPDVFMSPNKEPHYFCKDVNRAYEEHQGRAIDSLIKDEERYLKLFSGAEGERVLGEASVYYLYSDDAAREIHAFDPEARIVIMLREPVDFLSSLHARLLMHGDEDCPSLARALELEENRRRGEDVPETVRFPAMLYYSDYVRFTERVELYRDLFGAERVAVILLEDFRTRTEEVYRELLRFLGVEDAPLPRGADDNPNVEPRFRFLTKYLKRRELAGNGRLRGRVNRALARINSKKKARDPLDPALRSELMNRFHPEVERLGALLDRDLEKAWGYDVIA